MAIVATCCNSDAHRLRCLQLLITLLNMRFEDFRNGAYNLMIACCEFFMDYLKDKSAEVVSGTLFELFNGFDVDSPPPIILKVMSLHIFYIINVI